jgi:hypothetical protein
VGSGAASFRYFREVFDTQPVNTYHSGVAESSDDGRMAHKDMAMQCFGAIMMEAEGHVQRFMFPIPMATYSRKAPLTNQRTR